MNDKILLKEIFQFDSLLHKYNYDVRFIKNHKKIKLRFNTNWKDKIRYYDFVDMYLNNINDFEPYVLSVGNPNKSRNNINDIQFQFIEVESHK
ncbi:MAG: hypothetical protein PHO86_05475 [Bacilli bacterium]|nr:hypothetical protein [Bacilli bacterium]